MLVHELRYKLIHHQQLEHHFTHPSVNLLRVLIKFDHKYNHHLLQNHALRLMNGHMYPSTTQVVTNYHLITVYLLSMHMDEKEKMDTSIPST